MDVYCEKFDEERAERVIKKSVQKLGRNYLVFAFQIMCFPFFPLDLENALFRFSFFGI